MASSSSSSSSSTIKELDHLRIPLEEIVNATNNFAHKNIIGKGGLGNVYKGQLMRSGKLLSVSVRRFDCKNGRQVGNVEFLTEISILSSFKDQHNKVTGSLKDQNKVTENLMRHLISDRPAYFTCQHIVSMIGFCEEGGEKIIVNSYHAKGSLMMYLSDPASFTWLQRTKISLQVAEAIRYVHSGTVKKMTQGRYQGCEESLLRALCDGYIRGDNYLIIHRNINSSTILLDEDGCPRLSGFEYSIKVSIDRKDDIYLCEPLGIRGYMDPSVEKNGGVNHKSDIYSLGVVLFEILCGRKANQDNSLLAPLAKFHYEQGTLQDIIHPDLWKQIDSKSFKCFSDVAYSCLQNDWTRRPDIDQVLDTLNKMDHFKPEENLDDKSAESNYNKKLEMITTATWEERLRMCIDKANELNCLHNEMQIQKTLIHDDNNLKAKIFQYRRSVFHNNAYQDPEFRKTHMICKESDVFGFGVLMFEMFCGYEGSELLRLYDDANIGMTRMVRAWFHKDTTVGGPADVLKGENADSKLFLNKGPNKDSLDTFTKIIRECVLKERKKHPTMKVVVQELQKALTFQKNHKDNFRMSFEDIELATQNFSVTNVIGGGGFGKVYKGNLVDKNGMGCYPIVAKKLDTILGQGDKEFYNELQILYKYMHENIIGLVGYSNETDEKIIVYEHASKGSLDKYLNDVSLTWRNRLKICIDFATGLDFLHEDVDGKRAVIHRDFKSSNILLFDDWKAKVGDFGLSMISSTNSYTVDIVCGTSGYVDPLYLKSGLLNKESDIYSFGVVLYEVLCGKAVYEIHKHKSESLLTFIKHNFEKEDGVVFKAIKEEIAPESLAIFLNILYECLDDDPKKRPCSKGVLRRLRLAFQLQEDYDHGCCLGFVKWLLNCDI